MMTPWLQSRAFGTFGKEKKNSQTRLTPCPRPRAVCLCQAALSYSGCITGSVEMRRSRTGKPEKREDLSSRQSIRWVSTTGPRPTTAHISDRERQRETERERERCRKRNTALEAESMRAAKNDDVGTVIVFVLLDGCSSHMLGCRWSRVYTHHSGGNGKRLISASSAHRGVSSWKPFPQSNYAETLVFNGALRDGGTFHGELIV